MAAATPSHQRSRAQRATASPTVAVSIRLRPEIAALDCVREDEESVREDSRERPAVLLGQVHGECSYRGSRFKFADVWGPECTSASCFEPHRDAVLGVLRGFDATLMCYGQTGSGKTYTMVGVEGEPGLMPLAFDALFERIAQGSGGVGETGPVSYALQLSAIEIIEDRCVDLLHNRTAVLLRAAPNGGIHYHGLRELPVTSKAELLGGLEATMHARTVAPNYRHEHSSRSHTVVRLRIDSARLVQVGAASSPPAAAAAAADGAEETACADGVAESSGESEPAAAAAAAAAAAGRDALSSTVLKDATSATLTLIDLAGSEAALQNVGSVSVGQGIAVNKSLHWLKVAVCTAGTFSWSRSAASRLRTPRALVLTQVHELARGRPAQLRNSALTRLLAPALSGHCHVALLVNSSVRPSAVGARDTLDALAFGEAAGRVAVNPRRRTPRSPLTCRRSARLAHDGGHFFQYIGTGVGEGQLGKLQSLLVQMADDKEALASEQQLLRQQVDGCDGGRFYFGRRALLLGASHACFFLSAKSDRHLSDGPSHFHSVARRSSLVTVAASYSAARWLGTSAPPS